MGAGNNRATFLPPPADGGMAALVAFTVLRSNPADISGAEARALNAVSLWRTQGGDLQAVVNATTTAPPLPPLPASTSFVVLDRNGGAVACAISMNNLFGTGRIAPGTGILLAASPARAQTPLLAAAIAYNANVHVFRAAVAASGQEAAPIAVAVGLQNALTSRSAMPVPVPDPGRANVISCSAYLPGEESSCRWATDPRGAGLALGSD
jgi:gamma-glutamyltranspeptidase/glutathione hydrolase